jgi:hypothetical protein
MLDVKETKTIHTRMSMSDKRHVTLAAAVTASRIMSSPYLIFKGKSTERIASCKFSTFPAARTYACQEKAWMDKGRMHEWNNVVLCLSKEAQDLNHPCVQPPILILDAYRVQQMGLVVN